MAENIVWTIVEFLIGLFILPRLVFIIWFLFAAYLGITAVPALYFYGAVSIVLIIITWFIRKSLAIGFLIGTIWFFL